MTIRRGSEVVRKYDRSEVLGSIHEVQIKKVERRGRSEKKGKKDKCDRRKED
jgi:hypothetical protein